MPTMVHMLIICMIAGNNGELKEAWRVDVVTSSQNCLFMNGMFSGASVQASVSVKCEPVKGE